MTDDSKKTGKENNDRKIIGHEIHGYSSQEYELLVHYLQYENNAFWTRSGFFSVVNIILFQTYSGLQKPTELNGLGDLPFFCCFGIFVSISWAITIYSGKQWIKHWEYKIKKITTGKFLSINFEIESNFCKIFPIWKTILFTALVFASIWMITLLELYTNCNSKVLLLFISAFFAVSILYFFE